MKHHDDLALIHGLIDDCCAELHALATRAIEEGMLDDIPPELAPQTPKISLAGGLLHQCRRWRPLDAEARRLAKTLSRKLER